MHRSYNSGIEFPFSALIADAANNVLDKFNPDGYIGQVFGDFVATEVIASTTKSAVLKAVPANQAYSHTVAIKILSPLFQHLSGVEHTAMQAHYMAKLQHQNMVAVKSSGATKDGTHYVIMEYLTGENIVKHCLTNELPLQERLELFMSVCHGVSHMHIKGVVHSDLKPENVILNEHDIPKILDLDLSHATNSKFHDEFNYKNIKGHTTKYASPEQIENKERSTLSDIYAMSKILSEMLIGDVTDPREQKKALIKQFGSSYRYPELISIIQKAGNKNPSERYQNIMDMYRDVKRYIRHKKVVSSYTKQASYFYLTRHLLENNILFISITAIIIIISFVAYYEVSVERDIAQQSLSLFIKSNDPRQVDNYLQFEKLAEETYQKTDIPIEQYYNSLISIGNAYQGKGLSNKSLKFFIKAKNLYPEKSAPNRVFATSKLILAYYNLSDYNKITVEIEPYLNEVFTEKLTEPHYIQLFLACVEIDLNSKLDIFKRYKINLKKFINTLSKISLEQFTDENTKHLTKITLSLYRSIMEYYEIEAGDYSSVVTYLPDDVLATKVLPKLVKIRDRLEVGLNLIREHNIQTHLEPQFYIWIAFMESGLQNYSKAETYIDIGIEKTKKIFNSHHPETIDAYLKKFGVFRYKDPKKALEAVNEGYKRMINNSNSPIDFFVYKILIGAHLNIGDYQKAISYANEMVTAYTSKKEQTYDDIDSLTATFIDFTLHYLVLSDEAIEINRLAAKYEKDYARLNPDEADINLPYLRYSLTKENKSKQLELMNTYISNLELEGFRKDKKASLSILLAEYCAEIPNCKYEHLVENALKYMSWNTLDGKYSIEKLNHYIRTSLILIKLQRIDEADDLLNEVKPILDRLTLKMGTHHLFWHKAKQQVYSSRNEVLESLRHGEIALNIANSTFGNKSRQSNDIQRHINKLNNK